METQNKEQNLISLKEAAAILGYAPDYVGWLIRRGKIKGEKVYTGTSWQTTKEAILAYKNRDSKTDKKKKISLIFKKSPKYISLKDASEASGYEPNYIGWLIRTNKITGKKVYTGVSWKITKLALVEYRKKAQKQQYKKLKRKKTSVQIGKKNVSLPKGISFGNVVKFNNIQSFWIKRAIVFALVFIFVASGLPLTLAQINKVLGEAEYVVTFYASECSGDWQYASNAQGIPLVGPKGSIEMFSKQNSAIYEGGPESIVCGHFWLEAFDQPAMEEPQEAEEAIETMGDIEETETEIIEEPQEVEEVIEEIEDEQEINEEELEEIIEEEVIKEEPEEVIEHETNNNTELSFFQRMRKALFSPSVVAQETPSLKDLQSSEIIKANIKFSFALGEKEPDLYFLPEELTIEEEATALNKVRDFALRTLKVIRVTLGRVQRVFAQENGAQDLVVEESSEAFESEPEIIQEPSNIEEAEIEEPEESEELIEEVEGVPQETSDIEETEIIEEPQEIEKVVEETEDEQEIAEEEPEKPIEGLGKDFEEPIEGNETQESLEEIIDVFLSSPDAKIIVSYFSNNDWHTLETIAGSEISNALNNGYFSYEAILSSWEDVLNLKVRFEGIVGGETMFSAYLDSVWVEVSYIYDEDNDQEYVIEPLKKDWKADETPEFVIRKTRPEPQGLLGEVADALKGKLQVGNISLNQPKKGKGFLKKNTEVLIQESPLNIKLDNDLFVPGQHTLQVELKRGSKTYLLEQDFTWGVLAINFNKSIYTPKDKQAHLQFGVLDDLGNTICDAVLELEITNKDLNIDTYFSTLGGEINYSGVCGPNNVVDMPDYFALYDFDEIDFTDEIVLNVELTAHTQNGSRTIVDSLIIQKEVPFDVERFGPTRIYPPADYRVRIVIIANQDFRGDIIESVPYSFDIMSQEVSSLNLELETKDIDFYQIETGERKQLIWSNVVLEKGQHLELAHTFNAPNISPEIYFLGPLQFYE